MMQPNRLLIISVIMALLLLLPLIAMQFTKEVNWTLFDFVVAGVLLFGTGILCELAIRKIKNTKYRIAAVAIILAALLLLWSELAVGFF
ncbi:MAG TPA: hypothetical protein VLR29_08675 [Flavobacterium sp.]|nr:hypothetical protein [Flavobacterium sp.]